MSLTIYRAIQPPHVAAFPVLSEDQVVLQTKAGPQYLGFNHSRAWSAAMKYATTRPDYRDQVH